MEITLDWLTSTVERLAKIKRTEAASVTLYNENENVTRFAGNRITQNTTRHRAQLTVTAVGDRRRGSAATADLSAEGAVAAFRRAEAAARTAPADPEFTALPGPQEYLRVDRFFPGTASLTPVAKAASVRSAVDEAASRGMEAAGIYRSGDYALLVANTVGLKSEHRWTGAEFSVTATLPDATGSAVAEDEDARRLDPAAIAADAFRAAERGRNPRELKPDRYPTVLSARALSELLPFVVWQMDRRAADEGRSFFSGKLGTRIVSPELSLISDPLDPCNPGFPVDYRNDGLSRKKETFIEAGVLRNLWTTRDWAEKTGLPVVSLPYHFSMSGGEKTEADLVRAMDHGLFVRHVWYIRYVNPRDLTVTGTSRDGLFWVEDGEIKHAVKHMRFNDSPVRLLAAPFGLGRPERRAGAMLVPALSVADLEWTGGTTF